MAFDSSGTKAVWTARLGTTPKRCELQLFLAGIRQGVRRLKAFHLGRLNMQFQQDCPKDKKITALLIFWRKTEKFHSTEHYGAPLEWSTIFLSRQWKTVDYLSWNMQFSARQDVRLKNYRSKLFHWTVFKHGLLGGSTILFQYSTITRTPL